jgi:hypothetical protein
MTFPKEAQVPAANPLVDSQMIRPLRAYAESRPDRFDLFQAYRYPADRSRHFGPDLRTAQLQDHAVAILQ